MRKLAIFALVLLIAVTVLVTVAFIDVGFRNTVSGAVEGTMLAPIRNTIINAWAWCGGSFTTIAIGFLVISVAGGIFWVGIMYGLVWQRLIQNKLLGKTATPQYTQTLQNAPPPSPPQTVQPAPKEEEVKTPA